MVEEVCREQVPVTGTKVGQVEQEEMDEMQCFHFFRLVVRALDAVPIIIPPVADLVSMLVPVVLGETESLDVVPAYGGESDWVLVEKLCRVLICGKKDTGRRGRDPRLCRGRG